MPFVNAIRNMFRNRRQEREAEERRLEQSRRDREEMIRRASNRQLRIEPLGSESLTSISYTIPYERSHHFDDSSMYSTRIITEGSMYGTIYLSGFNIRQTPRERAALSAGRQSNCLIW